MPALCVIRTLSSEDVFHFADLIIPPERLPSTEFMCHSSLSNNDSRFTVLASLLVYTAMTRGHIIPRNLQLEAALASTSGRDSVVITGTGWGKMLYIGKWDDGFLLLTTLMSSAYVNHATVFSFRRSSVLYL